MAYLSCRSLFASMVATAALVGALICICSFDPALSGEDLQTEIIAGIPVHSHPTRESVAGRRLRQDVETDWVIVLHESMASDDKIAALVCHAYNKAGGKCLSSAARFLVVRATKTELAEVLKVHGEKIAFAEADAPMHLVVDPPTEERAPSVRSKAAKAPTQKAVEIAGVGSWGLDRIDDHKGLNDRYEVDQHGTGVHVYVLDTGIRTTHESFGGRAIPTLEVLGKVGNEDSPILVKECKGDATCANDDNGHGTHCAGTVGGRWYGVADDVTLHAVKILAQDGHGKWSWFLHALDWVVRKGERPAIVSSSLGGHNAAPTPYVKAAVQAAVDAGVTVIVAAGNDNKDACKYMPASAKAAFTVGATSQDDSRSVWTNPEWYWWFWSLVTGTPGSNYGSCVDIFAPGTAITSASNVSDFYETIKDGTSMAAPHVSGAAALLLEKSPNLSPQEVISTLRVQATRGVVTDLKGSPNYLLYVGKEPCAYSAKKNRAVKSKGTGGEKLLRSSYKSDLEYLNACKIACNEDSKCKGFVDDPKDSRGRMCKPKKSSKSYKKKGKAFYVKGSEC